MLASVVTIRTLGEQRATVAPEVQAAANPFAELEAVVAKTPTDAAGWQRLAAAYLAAERFTDAISAYSQLTALKPAQADAWSALGEARVLAANGVTTEAHAAFQTALGIDPKDPRARYFLAVEKDVAGDHKGAVADWLALLADSRPGDPWYASVRELARSVAEREKIDVAGKLPPAPPPVASPHGSGMASAGGVGDAIPGPSANQLAAASRLTPSQQNEMARGMVASLAAKLQANPRDADGWVRLMRAQTVLGESAKAKAALADAKRAFADDPAALARFDEAARTFGVSGG